VPVAGLADPSRGQSCFVDVDHGRGKRATPKGVVGGFEMAGQRLNLIPQRLGVDAQPLARHHPYLAFEWTVVRVFATATPTAKAGA
jgi:hypothetical protein